MNNDLRVLLADQSAQQRATVGTYRQKVSDLSNKTRNVSKSIKRKA